MALRASVSRDGPVNDKIVRGNLLVARFTHCIYVDERCLDTFRAWEEFRETHDDYDPENLIYAGDVVPTAACTLIDKDWVPPGLDTSGLPDIEGCDRFQVSWGFITPFSLPEIYNHLCSRQSGLDVWYCRPPLCYPGGTEEHIIP